MLTFILITTNGGNEDWKYVNKKVIIVLPFVILKNLVFMNVTSRDVIKSLCIFVQPLYIYYRLPIIPNKLINWLSNATLIIPFGSWSGILAQGGIRSLVGGIHIT